MRHARQSRLAEVGAERQARLLSSEAAVRSRGFAGEIEARYLAGAGVGILLVSEEAHARAATASDPVVRSVMTKKEREGDAPLPALLAALDPSARELAEGAYRALQTLRTLLAAS